MSPPATEKWLEKKSIVYETVNQYGQYGLPLSLSCHFLLQMSLSGKYSYQQVEKVIGVKVGENVRVRFPDLLPWGIIKR